MTENVDFIENILKRTNRSTNSEFRRKFVKSGLQMYFFTIFFKGQQGYGGGLLRIHIKDQQIYKHGILGYF